MTLMSVALALWLCWLVAPWCDVIGVAVIDIGAVLVLGVVFSISLGLVDDFRNGVVF